MGLLNNTSVYLSGPVELDNNCISWREEFTKFLNKIGVDVWDPLIKPDWMPIQTVGPDAQNNIKNMLLDNDSRKYCYNTIIRNMGLRLAYACDWMICVLKKDIFTAGTFEELSVASKCGKPILLLTPDYKILSMWLIDQIIGDDINYRDQYVFDNKEKLLNHIIKIDDGIIELDPLKWIFLSYTNKFKYRHDWCDKFTKFDMIGE